VWATCAFQAFSQEIIMFVKFGEGQHNEYLDWVRNNPTGYVWNRSHSRLHRADCRHVAEGTKLSPDEKPKRKVRASKVTIKVCASTKEEMIANVVAAAKENNHCSLCDP